MSACVRYNNSLGTIADNPLTSGATTVNFNSAPTWATLTSGQYIRLVLEPPTSSPSANFEVVYVTAYTSGATSATIERGMEGTSAVSHAQNSAWMVANTAADEVNRNDLANQGWGIIAQNFPAQLALTQAALSSTRYYGGPIGLLVQEMVTNILVIVRILGVGTAPTHIIAGLTDVNGNVVAVTGELGGATPFAGFTSGSTRAMVELPLSSAYVATASGMYVPFIWTQNTWGTTQMQLAMFSTTNAVPEGPNGPTGLGPTDTTTGSVVPVAGSTVLSWNSGNNAPTLWLGVN